MKRLKTTRTITVPIFEYNGKYYFRIRDIANLLEVKQLFQFTADIRKEIGENAILKYNETNAFRTKKDLPRTPFISAENLLLYFKNVEHIRHKINWKKKNSIERELKALVHSS